MSASPKNIPISDHPDSSTSHSHTSDCAAAQNEGVSRTRTEEISRAHSMGISHSVTRSGGHPSSDAEDSGPALLPLLDAVLTAVKRATGAELCTIDPRVALCLADHCLDGPDSRIQLMLGVQIPVSCIRGILRDHLQRIGRRLGPEAGLAGSVAGGAF